MGSYQDSSAIRESIRNQVEYIRNQDQSIHYHDHFLLSAHWITSFLQHKDLPLNEDIIDHEKKTRLISGLINTVLRQDLIPFKDFFFVKDQYIFDMIKQLNIQGKQIKRDLDELYLQEIPLILVTHAWIREFQPPSMFIETQSPEDFNLLYLQASKKKTAQKLKEIIRHLLSITKNRGILQILNKPNDQQFSFFYLENSKKNFIFQMLKNQLGQNNKKIKFPENFLKPLDDPYLQIESLQNHTILVEFIHQGEQFYIEQKVKNIQACSLCKQELQTVQVECGCKEARYCSKKCKKSDRFFHIRYCKNFCYSDSEESSLDEQSQEDIQQKGLSNLGNTCYMNSALQLLNTIPEFTIFFAKNLHKKDKNQKFLSYIFGNLLKELKKSRNKVINPSIFRHLIGRLNLQYKGNQQQDSQEFLAYLLDSLHEELKEEDKSLVTDLFQGEFESEVQCLECKKSSITKDQFHILSLPISKSRQKSIKIYTFNKEMYQNPTKLQFPYMNEHETLQDMQNFLQEQFPNHLLYLVLKSKHPQSSQIPFDFPSSLPLYQLHHKVKTERQELHCLYVNTQENSRFIDQHEYEILLENYPILKRAKTSPILNTLSLKISNHQNNIQNSQISQNPSKNELQIDDSEENLYQIEPISKNILENSNNISQNEQLIQQNSEENISLQDLIDKFQSWEYLLPPNQYLCGHCESKQDCKKSLKISQLPQYLWIHLKRFKIRKRKDFIRFSSSETFQHIKYKLQGVIYHSGDLGFGHYKASGCQQGKWYLYNDALVEPTDENQIVNADAYVLLYAKDIQSQAY